jgi:mono/diheme cytochrome c family protein
VAAPAGRARGLLVGLALAGAAVAAQAQATPAEQAEAGRRLYVMSCQRCHGINLATNGIGFDLRTFPAHDRERFDRSVTQGLRAMPAWGGTLKPGQLELLWAYIGAVNGWTAASASPPAPSPAASVPSN